MIFRDEDSVRPERDERFPLTSLEHGGKAGIGPAVRHGMDSADSAGGLGPRAARLPRPLLQTLGLGLGSICRFAILRALLFAQNPGALRSVGRAVHLCPRRRPSGRSRSALCARARSDYSSHGDHAGAGRLRRCPGAVVVRITAAALCFGSRLSGGVAGCGDCLLRARRGRWHASAWLVALCLLALHLSWAPLTGQVPAVALIATDIALPITMLMLVLGEMHARTRRLQAMQSMAESIASAQQYGSVVQRAVEELQQGCGVRACWFRLMEGGHLVATHDAGLSAEFLRDAGFAAITDDVSKLWEKRTPKA